MPDQYETSRDWGFAIVNLAVPETKHFRAGRIASDEVGIRL